METLVKEPYKIQLRAYAEECSGIDIVGEEGFLDRARKEFGNRVCRGTALSYHNTKVNLYYNVEDLFRKQIPNDAKRILEIGTFRGASTAVLAHYADRVYTVDILEFSETASLWLCFGVMNKITYLVVGDDEAKKEAVDLLDFDFAFIDGLHEYEGVKFDFEIAKRCGRVLFHDYRPACPGVVELVDSLPPEEVTIDVPFAYWERNGNS